MILRDLIVRGIAACIGVLPLSRLSRKLQPPDRLRFWRIMAAGLTRARGMPRAADRRPSGPAAGGPYDVLLVSDALYPERGGGTKSFMQVARRVMASGYRIGAVCAGPERRNFHVDGIDIFWLKEADELSGFLETVSARQLFIQQAWAPAAAAAAAARNLPFWYFVRSTSDLVDEIGPAIGAADIGQAIRAGGPRAEVAGMLVNRAERVVVNSCFMAEIVKHGFGRESDVVYPEVEEPLRWETKRCGLSQCIVAVATTTKKGVGVMLELAKAFPTEVFIVCGFKPLTPKLQRRVDKKIVRNLIPVGQLPTATLFALAKLVLVPSQGPEAFGRIVPEALLRGLPVLASRAGGIPEALPDNDCLVDNFTDPAAWVAKLDAWLREPGGRARRARVTALARRYRAIERIPGGWVGSLGTLGCMAPE